MISFFISAVTLFLSAVKKAMVESSNFPAVLRFQSLQCAVNETNEPVQQN